MDVWIDHKVLASTVSVRVTFLSFKSQFFEATLFFGSIEAKGHSELSTLPIKAVSIDFTRNSKRGA